MGDFLYKVLVQRHPRLALLLHLLFWSTPPHLTGEEHIPQNESYVPGMAQPYWTHLQPSLLLLLLC